MVPARYLTNLQLLARSFSQLVDVRTLPAINPEARRFKYRSVCVQNTPQSPFAGLVRIAHIGVIAQVYRRLRTYRGLRTRCAVKIWETNSFKRATAECAKTPTITVHSECRHNARKPPCLFGHAFSLPECNMFATGASLCRVLFDTIYPWLLFPDETLFVCNTPSPHMTSQSCTYFLLLLLLRTGFPPNAHELIFYCPAHPP